VTIRRRTPADDAAIVRTVDAAFGGPAESTLVRTLRDPGLAAIELVAAEDAVVGHALFSVLEVMVAARRVKALALAPVAVQPDRQRRGIGSALIRDGLGLARADGWDAVIVLGDPAYYARFGFSGPGLCRRRSRATRSWRSPCRPERWTAVRAASSIRRPSTPLARPPRAAPTAPSPGRARR